MNLGKRLNRRTAAWARLSGNGKAELNIRRAAHCGPAALGPEAVVPLMVEGATIADVRTSNVRCRELTRSRPEQP